MDQSLGEHILAWWRQGGPGGDPARGVRLTAEQTYFLMALVGIERPVGLDPLPVDPEEPAARRLMLGAASRSLASAGVIAARGDDARVADPMEQLLRALGAPRVLIRGLRASPDRVDRRLWGVDDEGAGSAEKTSDSDYRIRGLAAGAVGDDLVRWAAFPTGGPVSSEPPAAADGWGALVEFERIEQTASRIVAETITVGIAADGGCWLIETPDRDTGDGASVATSVEPGMISTRIRSLGMIVGSA